MHDNHVCHRDLKPDNLMIRFEGSEKEARLKVIDFNIASDFSKTGDVIRGGQGLRHWSAPETRKSLTYTSSSDLWTIGCVLYYMCSGEKPFPEECKPESGSLCIKTATENYSKEADVTLLRDLLEKLLKEDPTERLSLDEALKHEWIR
jgi:serine/threonine protein kinase